MLQITDNFQNKTETYCNVCKRGLQTNHNCFCKMLQITTVCGRSCASWTKLELDFRTEELWLTIVLRHKRALTIVHSCVWTLWLVHQCGNTDLSKLSEDEEWNLEAASSTVKKYYTFCRYM